MTTYQWGLKYKWTLPAHLLACEIYEMIQLIHFLIKFDFVFSQVFLIGCTTKLGNQNFEIVFHTYANNENVVNFTHFNYLQKYEKLFQNFDFLTL